MVDKAPFTEIYPTTTISDNGTSLNSYTVQQRRRISSIWLLLLLLTANYGSADGNAGPSSPSSLSSSAYRLSIDRRTTDILQRQTRQQPTSKQSLIHCYECKANGGCRSGTCRGHVCVKSVVENFVSKGCFNVTPLNQPRNRLLYVRQPSKSASDGGNTASIPRYRVGGGVNERTDECRKVGVLGFISKDCYCHDDFCNRAPSQRQLTLSACWTCLLLMRLLLLLLSEMSS